MGLCELWEVCVSDVLVCLGTVQEKTLTDLLREMEINEEPIDLHVKPVKRHKPNKKYVIDSDEEDDSPPPQKKTLQQKKVTDCIHYVFLYSDHPFSAFNYIFNIL